MKDYFEEKVSAICLLDGRRVHVVSQDGFEGEVDLAPLIDKGPLYEPLRTDESFHAVAVERGVPIWPGDFDFSPGTLRVWCEVVYGLGGNRAVDRAALRLTLKGSVAVVGP
jgi:hypothetical protein